MSKRVLIIGYWYGVETMGGVRLRRIARRLPQEGWEPVVLMPPRDKPTGAALPRGIRVEEVAAPDLAALYARLRSLGRRERGIKGQVTKLEPFSKATGLSSRLNRWFMIPDKQATWYRAAVRRGRELLRNERFDVIFASLDPRTCLLVAAKLSKESGVPCILEYRDLWVGNPYYHLRPATPVHGWLHRRLEQKALRQARRVSAVCQGIAEHLSRAHADILRSPIQLNYNFFDPEEYPPKTAQPAQRPLIISYIGAMYASRRPHQFFEGLRNFIDQSGLSADQLRFQWAGGISGIDALGESLDRYGLRPYVDFLGQVPHSEALQRLVDSDISLLIQAPDDAIHIPGKLFEALGARVPLLALANPCETSDIIRRCNAGIICSHASASITEGLANIVRLRQKEGGWNFNEPEVDRFCAQASVGRFAKLLEEASS